jgi:hypothetical protein
MLLKYIAGNLRIDASIIRRVVWEPVRDSDAKSGGQNDQD